MKGNPSSVIYRYIRLDFVTINQVVILDYTIIILEQRRKEEIEERYDKEVDNTVSLVNQAKDYEIACQIRNYILASCKEGELTEEKSKWIEWAKKKANWYDPTVACEDEYLGKRKHSLAEEEKELTKKRRGGVYGW